jgi:F-type H+-transporting ATPase subunit delta
MSANDLVSSYAGAFHAVAAAEGNLATVEEELFRVGQAIEGNDTLRATLSDSSLPVARRQQVVEDLLAGKASPTTIGLVSMVVGSGRADDLPAIVRALIERSAASRNRAVAEVRSAVPLSADQSTRLAAALGAATGKDVEIKVVIDPSVLGGLVTQIGDTVIDGSVRHRLNQVREAIA